MLDTSRKDECQNEPQTPISQKGHHREIHFGSGE